MAINLIALVAIQIGVGLLYRALFNRRSKSRQKPSEMQIPTAEDGRPLTIVYGIGAVKPNVVAFKDPVIQKDGDDDEWTRYNARAIMRICHGPIDKLIDIIVEEKSLRGKKVTRTSSWQGQLDYITSEPLPLTRPSLGESVSFYIAARDLFGGQTQGGGIEGWFTFSWGMESQAVLPLSRYIHGEDRAPGRPNVCYGCWGDDPAVVGLPSGYETGVPDGQFYWGAAPTPPGWVFIVQCIPTNLLGSYDDSRIGEDANPLEIIYDLCTNHLKGGDILPTLIDFASFQTAAQTCKDEGLGVSVTIDQQDAIEDVIDDVLRHINGVLFWSTTTGLLTVKLVRGDYEIEDLLEINEDNAWDESFKKGEAQATNNEVKLTYNEFLEGVSGPVTDEVITESLVWGKVFDLVTGYRDAPWAMYQINGTAPTEVTVTNTTKSITLTEGTDYEFRNNRGTIFFFDYGDNPNIDAGDRIIISYVSNPPYFGFKESTVQDQDLGNQQLTREIRSVTLDFPFYTREFTALWGVARQLRMQAVPLETGSFKMNRTGHALLPGSPCLPNFPEKGLNADKVFRVVSIELDDLVSDTITVNVIEDVFSDNLFGIPGGNIEDPSSRTKAPNIAIACGLGGDNVRIAFFPSDTNFTIRLWQADDASGTNRVLVDDFPGTTTFYDTATTGKYYQAQLVDAQYEDGDLTPWITCEPEGPPTDPTCVEPTITAAGTPVEEDATEWAVAITVSDPQRRHTQVRYRVQLEGGAFSDWTVLDEVEAVGDTFTYDITVTGITEGQSAVLEWQVDYLRCSGDDGRAEGVLTLTGDFPTEPPEPPGGGGVQSPIEIVIFGATVTKRWKGLPEDIQEITGTGSNQTHFDLTSFSRARIVAVAESSTLPVGAYTAVQFQDPDSLQWGFLDLDEGPNYPLDPDSISPDYDLAVPGEYVLIADDARRDVRLRGVTFGCDGDELKTIVSPRIVLQLLPGLPDPVDPPTDPTPPDPGSCDTPIAIDMSTGWSGGDETGVSWSRTASSAEATVTGGGTGDNIWTLVKTGLTPDKQHTFYIEAEVDFLPLGAFLEVVGGDRDEVTEINTTELLIARGISDGGGSITIRYGLEDVTSAGSGSSQSGNVGTYANQAAAEADGWVVENNSPNFITWNHGQDVGPSDSSVEFNRRGGAGNCRIYKDFACPVGAELILKSWGMHNGSWWHPASQVLSCGSESDAEAWNGTEHMQNTSRIATAETTTCRVMFTNPGTSLFGSEPEFYVSTWELTIVGGGSATATFSNLGYCEGTGLPEEEDPDDPDEVPPVPPVGPFPPPPTGGARPFGIHNISNEGYGYWNQTIMGLTPQNVENLLLECEAADTYLTGFFGPQDSWKDGSGRYKADLHIDLIEEMYSNVSARNILNKAALAQAPFTKRRLFAHYVLDEPNRADERYGGSIAYAEIERVMIACKTYFPSIPTLLRINPTNDWYVRKMSGLDHMWAEYHKPRGNPTTYRNTELTAAADFGHGLVIGIHYKHYLGPSGPSPRYVTPAELDTDGRILATNFGSLKSIMMGGWRWELGLVSQPGFMDSLRRLRDYYASQD
jgi:hypothetical protein